MNIEFDLEIDTVHGFSKCSPEQGDSCFWCGKFNDGTGLLRQPVCCCVSLAERECTDYLTFDLTGLVEMNKRLTSEIEELKARITKIERVIK